MSHCQNLHFERICSNNRVQDEIISTVISRVINHGSLRQFLTEGYYYILHMTLPNQFCAFCVPQTQTVVSPSILDEFTWNYKSLQCLAYETAVTATGFLFVQPNIVTSIVTLRIRVHLDTPSLCFCVFSFPVLLSPSHYNEYLFSLCFTL
jgi:hypothetical protein